MFTFYAQKRGYNYGLMNHVHPERLKGEKLFSVKVSRIKRHVADNRRTVARIGIISNIAKEERNLLIGKLVGLKDTFIRC